MDLLRACDSPIIPCPLAEVNVRRLSIVYTSWWKLAMERTPCKLGLLRPNFKEAAPWLRYPKVAQLSTPDTCLRQHCWRQKKPCSRLWNYGSWSYSSPLFAMFLAAHTTVDGSECRNGCVEKASVVAAGRKPAIGSVAMGFGNGTCSLAGVHWSSTCLVSGASAVVVFASTSMA